MVVTVPVVDGEIVLDAVGTKLGDPVGDFEIVGVSVDPKLGVPDLVELTLTLTDAEADGGAFSCVVLPVPSSP